MKIVYALSDPRTDVIRYVGETENPARRYYQHTHAPQRRLKTWVAGLRREYLAPVMWLTHFDSEGEAMDHLCPDLNYVGMGSGTYSRRSQSIPVSACGRCGAIVCIKSPLPATVTVSLAGPILGSKFSTGMLP